MPSVANCSSGKSGVGWMEYHDDFNDGSSAQKITMQNNINYHQRAENCNVIYQKQASPFTMVFIAGHDHLHYSFWLLWLYVLLY